MAAARWDSSSSGNANLLVARWRRRPPCLPPVRRSVAAWEKDFCESHGVPWRKVTDPSVGLNAEGPGGRVGRWDDSGAVEALLAARRRYWAGINGGLARRTVPPLPDPDMYLDVVVEGGGGGGVDPELDAEYEEARRAMKNNSFRVLTSAELPDDFVPVPTGWDV
ncbi:hypothetical protein ACP70R_040041 [Stipagrostis hirtigluma subsp. patula]